MSSDVNSEGEQENRTRLPHWSFVALVGMLLLAAIACGPTGCFSQGDSEELADGMPTLMPTAEAPDVETDPDSAKGEETGSETPSPDETSEPGLAPTYTPSTSGLAPTYTPVSWPITPTATITGSEMTATSIAQTATAAATLTPRPTATKTPTRLPLPTRTRYIPPPPATNTRPAAYTPPYYPGSTVTPTSVPSSNAWAGQYFASQNLSGAASVIRNDSNIQFNWGAGSPFPGAIPEDHFSVRWSRSLNFAAGTYRFSVFSDDGVRVYLDNQLIINQWTEAQNTVFTAQRSLSSGSHSLRVEYYENIGEAKIQFWWELTGTTSSAWKGEYFSNQTLSGNPTYIRNDQEIFFNWGTGSPGSGIPTDNFSIRWTREAGFNAGTYRFFVHSDDGVRVWVDGQLIIDQWHDATAEIYSHALTLSSGVHSLRVDYYENLGDAQIQFMWEIDGAYPNWRGSYFTNPDLTGAPSLKRNDVDINFDWGTGSPDPSIPSDNFSVRWTQSFFFSQGTYVFHARMDDGVRIYVDGALIVNDWRDGALREVSGDVDLIPGDHLVRVEYYERVTAASIKVWWEQTASPYPDWNGEYFDFIIEPATTATPVFVRQDPAVSFNWGSGSPGSGIPNDNFSVRWTRINEYAPGIYALSARSDDGIRVYVNGVLVIDEWHQSPGTTTYTVQRPITSGNNTIVVEYYEGEDAALAYFWTQWVSNLPE
jgi:hypothetical protein